MYDDSSAYLDAQLPTQNATYTVDLYDTSTTPETLINSIPGTTANGMIQEDWYLTYTDGTPYTGESVDAVFDVTLRDAAGTPTQTGKGRRHMQKPEGGGNEFGPNFDLIYMYTPRGATSRTAEFAKGGTVWNGMLGVVDVLIAPRWTYISYDSDFDRYTDPSWQAYPGYITDKTTIKNSLFPSLKNGITRNFYSYAHGSGNSIANAAGDIRITAGEVADQLKNVYKATGPVEIVAKNPYRFVFLDGCSTASAKDWRRAFGIFPLLSREQAARSKLGPQAYMGWAKDHSGWMTGNPDWDANLYKALAKMETDTLSTFFVDWMSGTPLAKCIKNASDAKVHPVPFCVPGNENLTITIDSVQHSFKNLDTSKIYIIGHSGIKVDGLNSSYDGQYAAPATTE
jgi:hypothetical protein